MPRRPYTLRPGSSNLPNATVQADIRKGLGVNDAFGRLPLAQLPEQSVEVVAQTPSTSSSATFGRARLYSAGGSIWFLPAGTPEKNASEFGTFDSIPLGSPLANEAEVTILSDQAVGDARTRWIANQPGDAGNNISVQFVFPSTYDVPGSTVSPSVTVLDEVAAVRANCRIDASETAHGDVITIGGLSFEADDTVEANQPTTPEGKFRTGDTVSLATAVTTQHPFVTMVGLNLADGAQGLVRARDAGPAGNTIAVSWTGGFAVSVRSGPLDNGGTLQEGADAAPLPGPRVIVNVGRTSGNPSMRVGDLQEELEQNAQASELVRAEIFDEEGNPRLYATDPVFLSGGKDEASGVPPVWLEDDGIWLATRAGEVVSWQRHMFFEGPTTTEGAPFLEDAAATALLDPAGTDNKILLTAVAPGPEANGKTAQIVVDSTTNRTVLAAAKTDNDIVVTSGDRRELLIPVHTAYTGGPLIFRSGPRPALSVLTGYYDYEAGTWTTGGIAAPPATGLWACIYALTIVAPPGSDSTIDEAFPKANYVAAVADPTQAHRLFLYIPGTGSKSFWLYDAPGDGPRWVDFGDPGREDAGDFVVPAGAWVQLGAPSTPSTPVRLIGGDGEAWEAAGHYVWPFIVYSNGSVVWAGYRYGTDPFSDDWVTINGVALSPQPTVTTHPAAAAQVITALNADPAISELYTASNGPGSNGSGFIAPTDPVEFSGGTLKTPPVPPIRTDGDDLWVATGEAPDHVWEKYTRLPTSLLSESMDFAGTSLVLGLEHLHRYIRLTGEDPCTISIPSAVEWPDTAVIYFRRATGAGEPLFSSAGGNVVPNDDGSADVPEGGSFAVKKNGANSDWDFI
jgi:hypothetical protein